MFYFNELMKEHFPTAEKFKINCSVFLCCSIYIPVVMDKPLFDMPVKGNLDLFYNSFHGKLTTFATSKRSQLILFESCSFLELQVIEALNISHVH